MVLYCFQVIFWTHWNGPLFLPHLVPAVWKFFCLFVSCTLSHPYFSVWNMINLPAPKMTNILLVHQGSSFKHFFLQKWNEFFLFCGPTEPCIELFRTLCTLYSLSPFLDYELLQRKDYFPILYQLWLVQGLAQSNWLNKLLKLLNHLLPSCHLLKF